MKENAAIEPKKVFSTIDENLKALGKINYDKLSKEEIAELRKDYKELIDLALKIKKRLNE